MTAKFGGRREGKPCEEFAELKQIRGVEEDIEAFELLTSQVIDYH